MRARRPPGAVEGLWFWREAHDGGLGPVVADEGRMRSQMADVGPVSGALRIVLHRHHLELGMAEAVRQPASRDRRAGLGRPVPAPGDGPGDHPDVPGAGGREERACGQVLDGGRGPEGGQDIGLRFRDTVLPDQAEGHEVERASGRDRGDDRLEDQRHRLTPRRRGRRGRRRAAAASAAARGRPAWRRSSPVQPRPARARGRRGCPVAARRDRNAWYGRPS